jgi:hypothetical protein
VVVIFLDAAGVDGAVAAGAVAIFSGGASTFILPDASLNFVCINE